MIALKKILVPTDFGEAADAALNYARALARNFGASIDVLHVADDVSSRMFAGEVFMAMPPTLQKDVEDMARKQLDARLIDNDPDPLPVRPIRLVSKLQPPFGFVGVARPNTGPCPEAAAN